MVSLHSIGVFFLCFGSSGDVGVLHFFRFIQKYCFCLSVLSQQKCCGCSSVLFFWMDGLGGWWQNLIYFVFGFGKCERGFKLASMGEIDRVGLIQYTINISGCKSG